MKRKVSSCKRIFFVCFALGKLGFSSYGLPPIQQNVKYSYAADSTFRVLDKLLHYRLNSVNYTYLSKKDSMVQDEVAREINYNSYRKEGINFWKKFRNDERRYYWFRNTMKFGTWYNRYWKNVEEGAKAFIERPNSISQYSAPLNWKDLNEWESLYPEMLKEYKVYCERNNLVREYEETLTFGLNMFLKLSVNSEYRGNRKMNITHLEKYFLPAAERILSYNMRENKENLMTHKRLNSIMNGNFISVYREYGLDKDDMKLFFTTLQKHSLFGIQEWAAKGLSLFLLMDSSEDFQLSHKAIDGTKVDFQEMRGKVVLIDFWATWCSVCIERMPAIRRVYDKYKSENFLVISVCLNDDDALPKVKEIKDRIGADWPTLLIGNFSDEKSLGKAIWEKYNFWGVPQILLFNKKGKLVLINDVLKSGDFEPIVRKLVAE